MLYLYYYLPIMISITLPFLSVNFYLWFKLHLLFFLHIYLSMISTTPTVLSVYSFIFDFNCTFCSFCIVIYLWFQLHVLSVLLFTNYDFNYTSRSICIIFIYDFDYTSCCICILDFKCTFFSSLNSFIFDFNYTSCPISILIYLCCELTRIVGTDRARFLELWRKQRRSNTSSNGHSLVHSYF